MLVDDEPDGLDGLSLIVRRQGWEPLCAHSAAQALEMLEKHAVQVLVCDECMPGMRGVELLQLASTRFPEVTRVMLTGKADLELTLQAINRVHVFRFLQKPCPARELVATIQEAIQKNLRDAQASRSAGLYGAGHASTDFPGFSSQERDLVSKREAEVLKLLVCAHDFAQIAQRLFISQHTVRNHVKSLFQKLQVHSQKSLIQKALGQK